METEEIIIIVLASVIFILILGFILFYAFQMNKKGDELYNIKQDRDQVASNYGSLLDEYRDETENRQRLQEDYDALHQEHKQYTAGVTRALSEDDFIRNQADEKEQLRSMQSDNRHEKRMMDLKHNLYRALPPAGPDEEWV